MSEGYSTTANLIAHVQARNKDGSYWAKVSAANTISYDRFGKPRSFTPEAHRSAERMWNKKPLTGNHRKIGLASNGTPIGLVHEARVDTKGDLYMRFTPTEPRAAELLETGMHEGFSIGVLYKQIEFRAGREVIVAYEPDHLTVAFYPDKPSCPGDVCNIVPPEEIMASNSTENPTMTTETTTETKVEATAPEATPAPAPAAEATPPAAPEAKPDEKKAEATEQAPPAPEAAPAPKPEGTLEADTKAGSPAEAKHDDCDDCKEKRELATATIRAELEAERAQRASLEQVVAKYEAAEREALLKEIGDVPEGIDLTKKSLADLRELAIFNKARAPKAGNSNAPPAEAPAPEQPKPTPEGSGAEQTPVAAPEPKADPKEAALKEAADEWAAYKKRYKML